jgi:hypothetical protein
VKMFDSALGQKNLSALWVVPAVLTQPAHLVERIGLAITGGACGLFVAVASSESSWISLLIMFYGAFAFYIGIDLPSRRARRDAPMVSEQWNAGHAVEMFSAIGTFLAAIPVFLSVSLIVLDETQSGLTILVTGCWAIGSSFQMAAGIIARNYGTAEIVVSDF